METYLNRNIREIINEFPKVVDILNQYNIGCITCALGTCPLKDIVDIHNLSLKDEAELFRRIADTIFPDKNVPIPVLSRKQQSNDKKAKFSPPMKMLVNEHLLIKRLLELIPEISRTFDIETQEHLNLINQCVDFIRNYADRFHHAKEEEILFSYFDPNQEIIKSMLADHDTARTYIKNVVLGMETKNRILVLDNLKAYGHLLTSHITKEDEILYPWMDRQLSDSQIGKIFSQFAEVDSFFGEKQNFYTQWVDGTEKKLK